MCSWLKTKQNGFLQVSVDVGDINLNCKFQSTDNWKKNCKPFRLIFSHGFCATHFDNNAKCAVYAQMEIFVVAPDVNQNDAVNAVTVHTAVFPIHEKQMFSFPGSFQTLS